MSEDRLEKALEAIQNETIREDELSRAHDRVLEKLSQPGQALCAEFQLQLDDYLQARLTGNRLLLMEDHLSRCANCRARMMERKNGSAVTAMPAQRPVRWKRWASWAAAAALLFAAMIPLRHSIDTAMARGPRATVDSVQGNLFLVAGGPLKAGATLAENQAVRTGPASHAILKLADGSRVEVNERTEVSVHAAWSGKVVHLQRGDIIVQAAKQYRGYLRVQTRDALASVKGTIFAVATGMNGSRVAVVEGAVAVDQAGSEVLLHPGEQTASNPALIGPIQEAVAWSADADTYMAVLASLSKIEKQLAAIPGEPMRTDARLVSCLPPGAVVYGAIPNISGTLRQAMGLVDRQSAENPAFGTWWNSANGQSLQQLLDRIHTLGNMLGDEVVFAFSLNAAGAGEKVPLILAEIKQDKHAALEAALASLTGGRNQPSLSYGMADNLLIVSNSAANLQWVQAHLGQGAETPFTRAIRNHYQRGVGWLLGMDISTLIGKEGVADNPVIASRQLQHLFLEQRSPQGMEENELALSFKGPRIGLASFLANAGSGGAAEYLSSDLMAAAYVSTREPRQLFDDVMMRFLHASPAFQNDLSKAESAFGISLAEDFALSVGTESALGIEGVTASGPVWIAAALVNDPVKLDAAIQRAVQGINVQAKARGMKEPLVISRTTANNRQWTTIQSTQVPLTITWTYDNGYMVAASDRGAALRAIAVRSGGASLIHAQEFRQQMPSSAGLHPSGFAWLNLKGGFANLSGLIPNAALKEIVTERDPILVVVNGSTEQIRASSRTRISGFIMDVLLLQSMGNHSRRTAQSNP